MRKTFVTFSIGDSRYIHRQANFAAVSILAHSSPAEGGAGTVAAEESPAIIGTDKPEYYRWLEKHVTVLELDAGTLKEWQAPYDYFWRIKLRLMQRAREQFPGHLIYMDSDVAVRSSLASFFASLDSGAAFMHKIEYFMASKGGTGAELWRQAAGRTFGHFTVDAQSRMWNAGLVALPAQLSESWIQDALDCLDALCAARVKSRLLEQFSLSLSLDREKRLCPAEDWFVHYWGNKTAWNAIIARFLADVRLQGLSVPEVYERFRELPLDLPAIIKRKRTERFFRSIRKRLFLRDHSVAAQLTRELMA